MSRSEIEIAAINRLYAVFTGYEFSSPGCSHCFSVDQAEALRTTPLRQLTTAQLRPIAVDVPNHWGGLDDFRHFAPRILDILLDGDFHYPDLSDVTAKLEHADWTKWPREESEALRVYFDVKWARLARGLEAPHRPAEMITAWACAGLDLKSALDQWLSDANDDGLESLASFMSSETQFVDGMVNDPRWPDGVARTVVADWLVSSSVRAAMESGLARGVGWSFDADIALTLITVSTWATEAIARTSEATRRHG